MNISELFPEQEKTRIKRAIELAETNTSGEIRVHVEGSCPEEVLDRAAYLFEKLEMHKTAQRNGVLFYLSVKDRKFAILGDAGINANVPAGFWDNIKETAIGFFREGRFAEGLAEGIRMAGEQLKQHFPYLKDDKNELSDEISFGKSK
ncbi:MAG TPA: TPM domain-containing protein [Prolixibacteraceae bacterium]|nr:TPM domain-containing protein [Prolixibacteraceae bacterium]